MAKKARTAITASNKAKVLMNKPGGPIRVSIVLMKGSMEYYNFIDAITRKTGTPKNALYRVSFREWCQRNGHGTPPEI